MHSRRSVLERRYRTIGLCLALIVMVTGGLDPARTAGADTTEEVRNRVTRAALSTYFHGIDEEIATAEVGQEGVPVLLELLADPEFPRRDNVVAFLGYLGGPPEREMLLGYLASPPASLSIPEEDRALLLTPQSLGYMAARGDVGALDALMSMTADGSGGGLLEAAATHGSSPESLRDDLLHMSLRGLAFAGTSSARQRLEDLVVGRVRPIPGRSFRPTALQALTLFTELHQPSGSTAPSTLDEDDDLPDSSPGLTGLMDPENRVHDSGMTFANHVEHPSPMTEARLDDVLEKASLLAGRADFSDDVACCISISREGVATTFGSAGDGLDIVDNGTEMSTVHGSTPARFKVVRAINYCGGTYQSNIIGCARKPGTSAVVVRRSGLASEAVLWLHEYGHNTGLSHNSGGADWVMYGSNSGSNDSVNAAECDRFHYPSSSTGMLPADIGACTDNDADDVQDAIDNCPNVANFDQTDSDGDGVGDACESNGEPFCGNGIREQGEQCDGTDLGEQTCEGLGHTGGGLACNLDCTLDESGCTDCGNGVRESGEECDGTDLGGQTCQELGYDGGDLACSSECSLDESDCYCNDLDGDGVTTCDGDCDDGDPTVYPGAQEICNDGIDQDCSGKDKTKGCGGKNSGGGGPKGGDGGDENCKNGVDDDGDGAVDCADSDCLSKRFCR